MTGGADNAWPATAETRLSAVAFRTLGAKVAHDRPSPPASREPPRIPPLEVRPEPTRVGDAAMPDADAANSAAESPSAHPEHAIGDVSRALLDIMAASGGSAQPHERAFAADMLACLVPRLSVKNLVALVERVCLMETAPGFLLQELVQDRRIEVSGPLLERSISLGDQDLLNVVAENDLAKQRMIARRRTISQALSAGLVATGDSAVLLTLIRNPGASFSVDSFHRLCATAAGTPSLQAPLATRSDTPALIAFELFWCLPPELRRYILSRFLTDSENLNKIMKIGQIAGVGVETPPPDSVPADGVDTFLDLTERGRNAEAIDMLIRISGADPATAHRIINDKEGEPLLVVLKVLGVNRTRFAEAIARLQASPNAALRSTRNPEDLRTIFDSLSHNKARVVLTYWAWAAFL